jgi:hypothetical protein
MNNHLFIGGPCDKQTYAVDSKVPFWVVSIHPKRVPAVYPTKAEPCMELMKTATYQRTSLNGYIVYLHEDITLQDAIGMLLAHYEI